MWVAEEIPVFCITDENHNRMRIISPVKELEKASKEEILRCLEANFHTALDVKYAISEGVIWVAFIHPLKELSEEQVKDALLQVVNANITFGTTYSSTDLYFPGAEEPEKTETPKKGNKRT